MRPGWDRALDSCGPREVPSRRVASRLYFPMHPTCVSTDGTADKTCELRSKCTPGVAYLIKIGRIVNFGCNPAVCNVCLDVRNPPQHH